MDKNVGVVGGWWIKEAESLIGMDKPGWWFSFFFLKAYFLVQIKEKKKATE